MGTLLKSTLVLAAWLAAVPQCLADISISSSSWAPDRIDIFGNLNSTMFHKWYAGTANWQPTEGFQYYYDTNASSPITLLTHGPNLLHLYFVGGDHHLKHRYWDGSSWQPEVDDDMGAGLDGPVSVSAWDTNRMDIVGRSTMTGALWHKAWTGYGWVPVEMQAWEVLGGNFCSLPVTVAYGTGRQDMFGIGCSGSVIHRFWDGHQYLPIGSWEDLGSPAEGLRSTVGASSWGPGRLDIWAVGAETGQLYHRFWLDANLHWTAWESLGGRFDTVPQIVSWGSNRVDILGRDVDTGLLLYRFWGGQAWSEWELKGDRPTDTQPTLVSVAPGNLNLIYLDNELNVKLQVWATDRWLPDYEGKSWYNLGQVNPAESEGETSRTMNINGDGAVADQKTMFRPDEIEL